MDDTKKDVVVVSPAEVVVDPIAAKDLEIAKLTETLGNYKHVALKRLGKLPGDADFVAGTDEKTGLTVEETVRKTLLEGEFAKASAEKDEIARKLVKENSELKLALKNRPGAGLGNGGSGEELTPKDNVFSDQQIAVLTAKATRLKIDPAVFIESAKVNFQKNR